LNEVNEGEKGTKGKEKTQKDQHNWGGVEAKGFQEGARTTQNRSFGT